MFCACLKAGFLCLLAGAFLMLFTYRATARQEPDQISFAEYGSTFVSHQPRRVMSTSYKGHRTYHLGYQQATDGLWYPSAAFEVPPPKSKRAMQVALMMDEEELQTAQNSHNRELVNRPVAQIESLSGNGESLNSHINDCFARYTSYDIITDSYVTAGGARATCRSSYTYND